MAKRIVRYLLEGDGTIPVFVENGGYWPVGSEMVGLSVDEKERHVPASVVRMSRADLIARLASMNVPEVSLDKWLEMIGMSDLT